MRTLVMVCLVAAGCSLFKKSSDPLRFFVLTAKEPATTTAPAASVRVGIDRVELPEYLVRDEMVTRLASNELKVSDFDRWGEPLKDSFARTLRHDLGNQLGDAQVVEKPYGASQPDLLLDVDVRRFERTADG